MPAYYFSGVLLTIRRAMLNQAAQELRAMVEVEAWREAAALVVMGVLAVRLEAQPEVVALAVMRVLAVWPEAKLGLQGRVVLVPDT